LERLLGPVLTIVSVIGVFFGFLAAILAYVILYGEYTHHFADSAKPHRMALQGAVVTFLVFVVLSIVFGYAMQYFGIF
jgi:amino acid permease